MEVFTVAPRPAWYQDVDGICPPFQALSIGTDGPTGRQLCIVPIDENGATLEEVAAIAALMTERSANEHQGG